MNPSVAVVCRHELSARIPGSRCAIGCGCRLNSHAVVRFQFMDSRLELSNDFLQ